MSASLALTRTATVTEVIENSSYLGLGADGKTIKHSKLNKAAAVYSALTSPPVTTVASGKKLMSAGAGTIDLSAIVDSTNRTISGTGLKVQHAIFRNPPENANSITITPGASNGYNLLGAAFSITLSPGDDIELWVPEHAPDIAGGAKEIDLAGTLAQGLEFQITMG